MSHAAYVKMATLLKAKAMDPDPINRGMMPKDLAIMAKIPQQTVSYCLRDELEAAKYGLYKLTPKRKRYMLWAYSQEVADKAHAGPFTESTGIDPKIQAAEVSKIVTNCPEPEHHTLYEKLEAVRLDYIKWGILYDDVRTMLNTIVGEHFTKTVQEAKENEEV